MQLRAGEIGFAGLTLAQQNPKLVLQWAVVLAVLNLGQGLLHAWVFSVSGNIHQAALASTCVNGVVMTVFAVGCFRLIFKTDEGWARLKLGWDEARQWLAQLLGTWGGLVGGAIIGLLAAGVAGAVLGVLERPETMRSIVIVAAVALAAPIAVYLLVRLSLITASSFARRRVDLIESWRLTKGQFWPLLWANLAPWPLIVLLAAPGHVTWWLIDRRDFASLAGAAEPLSVAEALSVGTLVATPLLAIAGAVNMLLMFAPAAEAYRQLALAREGGEAA